MLHIYAWISNATGACLEQVKPIESCPHLIERYETDEDTDQDVIDHATVTQAVGLKNPVKPQQPPGVPIYPGEALIAVQADALASESETTVVIVAGDVDSGKTTLIGCSYSSFLEGPVGIWRFAGSRTLLGYDRRVHNHRVSSNQDAATTEHSSLGVDEYYHLDVQSTVGNQRHRLLLHDISGEAYQNAIDAMTSAEELAMVRRADVVVILLDGNRLLKKARRGAAVSRLLDLLLSVARVGHLAKNPPVQIVVSRWDYVIGENREAEIQEVMAEVSRRVENRLHAQNVNSPVIIQGVASISHDKAIPAGLGFQEVFEFWTTLRPKSQPAITNTLSREGRQEGWIALKRVESSGEDDA